MSVFDENPLFAEPNPSLEERTSSPERRSMDSSTVQLDPQVAPEQMTLPPPSAKVYPSDLQISWSWAHLTIFLVFILISLVIVQGVFMAVYAPHQKMSPQQLEEYFLSKPQVAIGSTVIVYGLMLFFLYVTLGVLRGQPFWKSLGWRSLSAKSGGQSRSPLMFFFVGCMLSLVVFGLTSVIQPPENTPIEQVFKFKQTAMLFVATAVFIAPLAEETIFRGYLYPMFARWFGVVPSIIVTGVLFGLMHGPQLGGEKSLIAVMSFVGIIFTAARARTGSVVASYLMHLGYNSLIAASMILATHGFTQIPQHH